jgi:phosphate uptake regulator
MENHKSSLKPRYVVQPSGKTGAVVTLHPEWRKEQGVKVGDFVEQNYAPDGESLMITPIKKADPS